MDILVVITHMMDILVIVTHMMDDIYGSDRQREFECSCETSIMLDDDNHR